MKESLPPPPEAVKKSGYGEMIGATHVQGPGKFAWQNEAVLSLLPVVDSTSGMTEGKPLCIYLILFQVACVPSRKVGKALGIIPVPPILPARIFPSPGQREKLISSANRIFSQLPSLLRGREERG